MVEHLRVRGERVDILTRHPRLLEAPRLGREEVHAVAADTQVLDHVDMLVETLETLRRRLAKLSASLR